MFDIDSMIFLSCNFNVSKSENKVIFVADPLAERVPPQTLRAIIRHAGTQPGAGYIARSLYHTFPACCPADGPDDTAPAEVQVEER